jgi:hypothetical protein
MGIHGFVALASLTLIACQPMYGEKPDTLGKVKPITKKDGKEGDTGPAKPAPRQLVDTCSFNSHVDPKLSPKPDAKQAAPFVKAGEAKLANAQKEPAELPRVKIYQQGIDDYREALKKDPYDADATLGLARAYDGVNRSRCAILLVKRLKALQTNDKYRVQADRALAEIDANQQWFKEYRDSL